MPSSPSSPIAGARSRVGSVPCSYHSSTCGSTRSAAKRRTVSAMSRSSSESRPSRSSGSSGRTLGRVAVADMPPSVVGLLLPWREHGGDPGVADADRRSGGYRRRQRGQIEHKPSPGRTVEAVRADMAGGTPKEGTPPPKGGGGGGGGRPRMGQTGGGRGGGRRGDRPGFPRQGGGPGG